MKLKTCAAILLAAGISSPILANIINWPSNNEWNPLYSNGLFFSDIPLDTGNKGHLHLDIVGDSTYAGGYLMYRSMADTPGETEDQLLIRIRLNSLKNKMPGAYQVFFETDGDSSVEWVLQLDTTDLDSAGTLQFGSASGTNRSGVVFGSVDWTGTYAENVNWIGDPTGDGSQFDGDDDYFLDLSMPWVDFSNLTGITSTNDAFRVFISSSQSAGQIDDGDVGNSSVAPNVDFSFADVYSDATMVLILGNGATMLLGRRIFRK